MSASAEHLYAALEQRLLAPTGIDLRARMELEGIITGELNASLFLSPTDVVELSLHGDFNGSEESLTLIGDPRSLRVHHNDSVHVLDHAAELREGLVLGLLRMGLMHNLACLLMEHRLDGVDGSVRGWLSYHDLHQRSEAELFFGISVRGENCAHATLLLDAQGLPQRREQEVVFPAGHLLVHETYSRFQLFSEC